MCSDTSPRLSVLIPCYCTAAFIGRCLSSLVPLAQDGIEIVIADDCSPDDTYPVLLRDLDGEAAPLKSITRIIRNDRNLGVADTRNRLLTHARGKRLLFIDSDDYIDPSAVMRALDVAEKSDADITAAPYFTVTGTKIKEVKIPTVYDLNKLPVHVKSFSLCNKIIRTGFLTANRLRFFDSINRWEDLGLMSRVYALAPYIVTIEKSWYYYTVCEGRTTLSSFARDITVAERSEITCLLEKWMAERDLAEKYKEFLTALKFYAKAGYLRPPRDIAAWRSTFPEAHSTLSYPSALPLPYRIAFMLLNRMA